MADRRVEDPQWQHAAEEAPVQQPMRERTKPVQRRKPSADQKRVRRQMQREAWGGGSTCPSCGLGVHPAPNQSWRAAKDAHEAVCPQKGQAKTADVQTAPIEQTHTRTIADDADFDPYLVWRCKDHGSASTGDRASQEHYIESTQQCRNEAQHPDPNRRRAHQRWHAEDGHHCWSCCDEQYIARPGERESGRIAKRHTMKTTAGSGGIVDEPEARHYDPAKSWNMAEGSEPGDSGDSGDSGSGSTTASMRKGAPFAGYEDFEDCVRQNSDKGDPKAYCGFIKHKVEDSPKESALQTLSCRACGHCGQGRRSCALCGSTAVAVTAEIAKEATQFDRNVATSDGRLLINPGEQIRTPTGQTVTVNNIRRHETSRDHYYLDTDMGTTLVPWSTNFQVVPSNNQQQELPGYGRPGGNANEIPFSAKEPRQKDSPDPRSNQAPQGSTCPVCGGTLQQSGDKYQCSRCGYTDQFGGPGGQDYSNATQRFTPNKTSQSMLARRATEVLDQMKETSL
jgi:hypothetical protein